MPSVTVIRKDGTQERYEERGRAGGSWTMTLTFQGEFAIITDEWGNVTAIPTNEIRTISQDAPPRSW